MIERNLVCRRAHWDKETEGLSWTLNRYNLCLQYIAYNLVCQTLMGNLPNSRLSHFWQDYYPTQSVLKGREGSPLCLRQLNVVAYFKGQVWGSPWFGMFRFSDEKDISIQFNCKNIVRNRNDIRKIFNIDVIPNLLNFYLCHSKSLNDRDKYLLFIGH